MTVLRLNTDQYVVPRRRSGFAGLHRRGGYSVYNARQTRSNPVLRRDIVMEKSHPLPAFSEEGVRWDVLVITLSLVLLLFVSILCVDTGALLSGGRRISKLNAGIASLEADNSMLREQISRAAAEPFTLPAEESSQTERVVILSPAPVE